MVKARKYVVVSPFEGEPKKSDFRVVEEELPSVCNHEFMAEAIYFSVDPYQRMKLGNEFPCDMIGGQIAKVTESKNSDYPVGTIVMGHFGWRTHTVVNPKNAKTSGQQPYMYALPEFGDLPLSLGLGVLGRVGITAYFGLMDICRPKPGETVAVTAAAGAVGSHVGQIAKIQGCRVIGFAGTDEKCEWLEQELGFDKAANYKTTNIAEFLNQYAPNGIDCYFDNVGGELSSRIISRMNEFGRIAVCGSISSYNNVSKENIKGHGKMALCSVFAAGNDLLIHKDIALARVTRDQESVLKLVMCALYQCLEYFKTGRIFKSILVSAPRAAGQHGKASWLGSYFTFSRHRVDTHFDYLATLIQPYIVGKQLKMEGFLVNRFADRTIQGIEQNLQWVKDKRLKYREHVHEGFENAVDAFIGLFSGNNIGKTLVKVK